MTVEFEMWMGWAALGVLILLALSAFFSGSETALTATSKARMLTLDRDKNRRAGRVLYLIEDKESLIGAILLGNNLVNILASSIAAAVFLAMFGEAGVPIATLVMTALVLIFSEVMPKTYAISNPDRMALAVSLPIRIVVIVFSPVVAGVQTIVRGVLRLLGANVEGPVLSAHEEIRGQIDLHHEEGGVVKEDRDMLGGVLDLR
ncbi:CNNM domain-containing protein, partial [Marinicauda pacifica]